MAFYKGGNWVEIVLDARPQIRLCLFLTLDKNGQT